MLRLDQLKLKTWAKLNDLRGWLKTARKSEILKLTPAFQIHLKYSRNERESKGEKTSLTTLKCS